MTQQKLFEVESLGFKQGLSYSYKVNSPSNSYVTLTLSPPVWNLIGLSFAMVYHPRTVPGW